MKGVNSIKLNTATIKEMAQEYLDRRFVSVTPKVVSIDFDSQDGNLEITLDSSDSPELDV